MACVVPNILHQTDDDDDDDQPLVFKRRNTASKQKQLNSEANKPASKKPDGHSGSPSGKSSPHDKTRTVPPVKKSIVNSSLSRSSSSPQSSKALPVKSPLSNSKITSSSAHQSKNSTTENTNSSSKEEKNSNKKLAEPDIDSEDSDDKRPLSFIPAVKTSIENLNHVKKGVNSSLAVSSSQKLKATMKKYSSDDSDDEKPLLSRFQMKFHGGPSASKSHDNETKPLASKLKATMKKYSSDDSDDEKPLLSRFQMKSHGGPSASKSHDNETKPLASKLKATMKKYSSDDSDDEKPLLSRFQMKSHGGPSASKSHDNETKPLTSILKQNGSTSRDEQRKSTTLLNKRPLDKVNNSSQSLVKKPKISNGSQLLNNKSPSIKSERKEDGNNISKENTSNSKSASMKHKTTIAVSSMSRKITKNVKTETKKTSYSTSAKMLPSTGEGQKWTTLVHNGVIFPPPYKPHGVKMLYKGKPVDLTPEQEEVATMFAVMLETDYAQKEIFRENFFNDWRKLLGKNHVIQNLGDCDFTPIFEWYQREKEKKKQMTTEEKKALKEEKSNQEEKYTWAILDGVKEKVGNFRVEPPGLFRGRGEHPKMGKLKRRIRPGDITINIGKGAPIPECPIPGESWKEVKHDNTVTWLAFWNDPINTKEFKYVFLAASSTLKGQSDKEKYEKARTLKDYIHGIRASYTKNFASKDVAKQQIAVATYLIDKLALRAGNEKDDDEADTVGCCTLKVENVTLVPPNKLEFDFLGKDSIRYNNVVEVELPVYKAIGQFQKGKRASDDLFDELDTTKLNTHLKELMPGLTAKVFRTYNASITLDEMLARDTKGGEVAENIVVYQHANKEVAIICNHQRTISKSHASQISKLNEKIDELKGMIDELETDLARAKKGKPPLKGADGKQKRSLTPEVLARKIAQTNAKIEKIERDKNTKEDLKTVALGTSKINYLDPRISVAWCKRHEVPIEKIFTKSLLAKFAWAMDVDPDFRF